MSPVSTSTCPSKCGTRSLAISTMSVNVSRGQAWVSSARWDRIEAFDLNVCQSQTAHVNVLACRHCVQRETGNMKVAQTGAV